MEYLRRTISALLRHSEKYVQTDMTYVASGGFWITVNQAMVAGSGLLLSIAYANLLDPVQYGMYRYILSCAALLAVCALPSMNVAYGRAVARGHEGDLDAAIAARIRWGLIGSFISAGMALYYALMGNSTLALSFFITTVFLPFLETFNIYDFLFQGRRQFGRATIYGTAEQCIGIAAVLAALFFHPEIPILVLTYFLSWTLTRFGIFLWIRARHPVNHAREQDTLTYGKHLSFINLIPTAVQQIDKILVFQLLGPVQLAYYNFATIIPDQIKSYFKNLQSLAFPKMSSASPEIVKAAVARQRMLLMGVLIAAVIAYAFAAPFLFSLLFPQYLDTVIYSQVYALSAVFTGAALSLYALQAAKKQTELYRYNAFRGIAQLVLMAAGIYFLGLWGLIAARIASDLVTFVIGELFVRRSL